MKKQPLTDRQQQAYDFIRVHIEDKGWPPTVREIAEHVGTTALNGVSLHPELVSQQPE